MDSRNLGTLELTDSAGFCCNTATLFVQAGTLVNASGGTIVALPGTQTSSARTLTTTELDNQGTVTIGNAAGATLGRAGAQHLNSGTITLTGPLTLTQSGTSPTFTNSGTVSVASGQAWTVNGGLLDVSNGTVNGPGSLIANTATLTFRAVSRSGAVASTAHEQLRRHGRNADDPVGTNVLADLGINVHVGAAESRNVPRHRQRGGEWSAHHVGGIGHSHTLDTSRWLNADRREWIHESRHARVDGQRGLLLQHRRRYSCRRERW